MEAMDMVKESTRTCGGLFELTEKRNVFSSALAGILFAAGWWCIIDVAVTFPDPNQFRHEYHVVGVMSTIAFFMINAVSNAQVRGEGLSDGCVGPRGARVFLFLGFVLGFTSVIGATWILFKVYVAGDDTVEPKPTWPGIGLFLQNILIFMGAMAFRFGRKESDV